MTAIYVPLVLVLLAASALFSATETALFALGSGTLSRWRAGGTRWQQLAARLMADHHGTLIAILLGNNFVNILLAILLGRLSAMWASGAMAAAVGGLMATALVLVFGEVMPKTLAYNHANRLAPQLARLLYPGYEMLERTGLIKALRLTSGALLRRLRTAGPPAAVSAEEYETFIQLGRTVGIFGLEEADLLAQALRLRGVTAAQAMTPRTLVDWMPLSLDEVELAKRLRRCRHRLVPVAEESLDSVVGVLATKRFLMATPAQQSDWRHAFVQPALYIPETSPLTTVLERMRREGQRLALIVDEYGGVEGLLTLEDIIEEMIGEMEDEYDQPGYSIVELGDGRWEVGGTTPLATLARSIPGLEWPETAAETVGGLLAEMLGRMPQPGDRWDCGPWQLAVRLTTRHRVTTVELARRGEEEPR